MSPASSHVHWLLRGDWLLPVAIALLFFLPVQGIPVSPDGAYYAGQSLNLLQGKGLTHLDGRPVLSRPLFPTILSLAFVLFGFTPITGYFVVKLFALGNIGLVYSLTRALYDRTTALVAGLLIATSYRLNEWSGWLNLDFVLPFFLLLFFILYLGGLERRHWVWYCGAGVALGLACLVKEVALLFLPLPLLYGLVRHSLLHSPNSTDFPKWSRGAGTQASGERLYAAPPGGRSTSEGSLQREGTRAWLQTIWVWAAFLVTLAPGLIYLYLKMGAPLALFGGTFQWASAIFWAPFSALFDDSFGLFSVADFAQRLVLAPAFYFGWQLLPHFILAPLFVLSMLYVLFDVWNARKLPERVKPAEMASERANHFHNATARAQGSLFILTAVALFLPMIFLQGIAGFRERQGLILMYLLLISLAAALTRLAHWLNGSSLLSGRGPRMRLLLASTPVLFALTLQLSWDMAGNARLLLQQMNSARVVVNLLQQKPAGSLPVIAPQPWWPAAKTIRAARQFVDWADAQGLAAAQNFYTFEVDARYLNFLTGGIHQFALIRPVGLEANRQKRGSLEGDSILINLRAPNALLSWRLDRKEALPFYTLQSYLESELLAEIREKSIDYVIIGNQAPWLSAYFLLHPDFEKVAEFEYGEMVVFRPRSLSPSTVHPSPIIERSVPDFLAEIHQVNPLRHEWIVEDLFLEQFRWSPSQLASALETAERLDIINSEFRYVRLSAWIVETQQENVVERRLREERSDRADFLLISGTVQALHPNQAREARVAAAVSDLQRAFSFAPRSWRAVETVLSLEKQIPSPEYQRLVDSALNAAVEHLKVHPNDPEAYLRLAALYRRMEKPAKALEVFRNALDSNTATSELYYSFADTLVAELEFQQARQVLQTGLLQTRWDDPWYAPLKELKRKMD